MGDQKGKTFEMASLQHHSAVGLSDDAGHNLKLNQATFFRCVEDDNAHTLQAILRNRKVDVNAYNDEVRRKFFINCVFVCFVSAYVEIECCCDQSLGIFQFLETGPRIFLHESRFSALFSGSQEENLAFCK